jgi:hypothetical protein
MLTNRTETEASPAKSIKVEFIVRELLSSEGRTADKLLNCAAHVGGRLNIQNGKRRRPISSEPRTVR